MATAPSSWLVDPGALGSSSTVVRAGTSKGLGERGQSIQVKTTGSWRPRPRCTHCLSQAEERGAPPLPGWLSPPSIAWVCWLLSPPTPPQTPSTLHVLPKQPQRAAWGWKALAPVPTASVHLVGKKRFLSSCHSPVPGAQLVPPLWGKELEMPSRGCSCARGQGHW